MSEDVASNMVEGSLTAGKRPALRGYIHLAAALISPFALVALIRMADSPSATVGAAIFCSALILAYSSSAAYHLLPWRALQRVDHAMIFVLIAGTFTPFTLRALSIPWGIPVLATVWALAGAGIVGRLLFPSRSRWMRTGPYIVLGWVALVPAYQLWRSLPHAAFALILVGGALYSIGGLVYATRRPDPFPAVFGYHEVFHALTVAAGGVFYFVIASYVVRSVT